MNYSGSFRAMLHKPFTPALRESTTRHHPAATEPALYSVPQAPEAIP